MANIFDWLFKTKNNVKKEVVKNVVPSRKKYKISDEVIDTLNNWNKINNNLFTIDDILAGLCLNGATFIDIKSINYPIYEDVWKIPGYVGSFKFDVCVCKENALNEYSKRVIQEAGENQTISHIVHLCKDGAILNMSYKKKDSDFRNFKVTYKLNKLNSECKFDKTDILSLVITEPYSIYRHIGDRIIYSRQQDKHGYYILNVNFHLDEFIGSITIKFKLMNNEEFDFPNEVELVEKIKTLGVTFPETTLVDIMKYLKKYNVEVEDMSVKGIANSNNISRSVTYQNINGDKKVYFNKTDYSINKNEILKTIDVSTVYGNGCYYVRTFTVKTCLGRDMILKVHYNNSYSLTDRDLGIIDYFMGFFPVGLIDNEPEWYPTDIHFRLLCDEHFNNNMYCIDKIELESYINGELVDSNKWERYNLVHTQSEEDSEILQEQSGPGLVKKKNSIKKYRK